MNLPSSPVIQTPKISVIVPVYNVEAYLVRCLDSICQQTERNIEIIIINDASPDNSQSIIDQYAAKDKRIISMMHSQNKGPGAARNTGIEKASAPWLMFVDSDDYIPSDAVAVFLQKTKKYPKVKLFAAGTTRVTEDGESWDYDEIPAKETLLDDPFYNYCFQYDSGVEALPLSHAAWAKLFSRDIFLNGDLRFPPKTIMEDFALGLPLFNELEGPVLLLSVHLYFYVVRDGSIMSTYNKQKLKEFAQVLQNLSAYATGLAESKRSWAMHRIYSEFRLWMWWLNQAYSPDFEAYLLMRSPEHCVTRFLKDNNQTQIVQAQQNRWYRFGQLSRKRKLWVIGKALSKKLKIYRLLQPLAKFMKDLLQKR